jgi:hypothetical protein
LPIDAALSVADEPADVAKKIDMPGTVMTRVRDVGRAGEDAVRAVHDIGKKATITINGRDRIPDGLNRVAKTMSEVKNVQSLNYTRQIRDYAQYAKDNGLMFRLFVPQQTARHGLSGPLQSAIERGEIILEIIPGT